ncbi:hypothetical protein TH0279_06060 [Helicobacter pylori]
MNKHIIGFLMTKFERNGIELFKIVEMLKLASCISLATLMRVSFKSYNIIGFWHSKIDLQKNTIISINIVSFLTPFKRTQV